MDRIQHATVFATQAHSGQKRKYTGDDYVVHPNWRIVGTMNVYERWYRGSDRSGIAARYYRGH